MAGHTSKRSHCQNCDAALAGPYCAACGQHDVDYHRSIGPIIEDALEGVLHFDGKFFKSVLYLFSRPGFLTSEFIAGRRTRYAHPLRFYIFASFLFFAASALQEHPPTPTEISKAKAEATEASELARQIKHDDSKTASTDSKGAPAARGGLREALRRRFTSGGTFDEKAFAREVRHLLPTMLFLCTPLLAAVLKLVYLRSGRLFIEHLIFALHVQALLFLAMLGADLGEMLGRLVGSGTESAVGTVFLCLSAWLVFRSFRAVYGQRPGKTLAKITLVGTAYGAILVCGVVVVVLLSAYLVSGEG